MSTAFSKINSFVENLAEKFIDLGGNGITVALTNTAHISTWDELADLTQISYTNCSSRVCTVASSTQSLGTYTLTLNDLTLSASGTVGPFRYVYLFDDNSTGDKLIGYYDYGSSLTLGGGESFAINFDGGNGVLTIV